MLNDLNRLHPGHRRSLTRSAGLFLLALAPGVLAAQSARLRGEWQLDPAHSDSVPERDAQFGRFAGRDSADTAAHPSRGGSRPEPAGVPYGGGGGRYRSLDSKDLARMHQTVQLVRVAPEHLSISADGKTLTLTGASGAAVTWPIDGRKVSEPVEGGGAIERRVRWRGDALVIERKVDGGGKAIETCRLGLGGNRLLVFVEVTGLFQPLEFRRQYEPAGPGGQTGTGDSDGR